MKLQKMYVDAVNYILRDVDFRRLAKSCNSQDQTYATDVLNRLHQAFVNTYGSSFLPRSEERYVSMPAVIRGKRNGDVTIGLIVVDMSSSGELVDAVFFTPDGILDQHSVLSDSEKQYLLSRYIPFDYWYTPEIAGERYVNFEYMPSRVYSLLSSCAHIASPSGLALRGS